jgi:hypothetical protein
MTQHAFIVTSAINSKFGVYSPAERLDQTVATVSSIKSKIPNAGIIIMECCGTPIKDEQAAVLKDVADEFHDFSHDEDVQALYDNDNWDVVKNGTEIMVFGRLLKKIKGTSILQGVDRMHKMSGRYTLNEAFDPGLYDRNDVVDKIVIGNKYNSQFPVEMTTQPWQYMARLWSWPISRLDEVIEIYENSLVFFAERLAAGGYIDIEHVLARFINPDHVIEIQNLGVEGKIAPNGSPIKN